MKKILIIGMLFWVSGNCLAQQQVMFTQYMFNQLALNPAYAGIHDGISANALLRQQWVGFEGAPSTQTFSLHTPIGFTPIALGGMILRDQIGATTQHSAYFSYAYRIRVTENSKLSFGLQGSFSHYRLDFESDYGNDPALANAESSIFKPNFGTGILWHSDKFYLGLGIPNALNQSFDKDNPDAQSELIRHYYLSGGYVFPIVENVLLKPNFLLKAVDGAPVQVDLNLNVLLQNRLWLGVSYRSLDSFDALVQFQVTPQLQVGYGFDFYTTSDIREVSSGSHEIMLSYIFELPRTKILTPRYF